MNIGATLESCVSAQRLRLSAASCTMTGDYERMTQQLTAEGGAYSSHDPMDSSKATHD